MLVNYNDIVINWDLINNLMLKGWEYWIWMCIFVGIIYFNRKLSLIKKRFGYFCKIKGLEKL